MKEKNQKLQHRSIPNKKQGHSTNDLFNLCLKKGLIEKTPYGYYFKPEFFETLDIYEE